MTVPLSKIGLTWGSVTQVTPLQVRINGDTGDTPIALMDSGMTFSVSDKVGLVLLGSQWAVFMKVVAT